MIESQSQASKRCEERESDFVKEQEAWGLWMEGPKDAIVIGVRRVCEGLGFFYIFVRN